MTPEKLDSSGLLDGLFKNVKGWPLRRFKENILCNIAKGITYHQKLNKKNTPYFSRYLTQLKRDFKILNKIQAGQRTTTPIQEITALKIKVIGLYLQKQRNANLKNYATDLFFYSLFHLLRDLKFKERIEILANIQIIMDSVKNSFKIYKTIKSKPLLLGKQLEDFRYFESVKSRVKTRLNRVRDYYKQQLQSNEYIAYQKHRLNSMASRDLVIKINQFNKPNVDGGKVANQLIANKLAKKDGAGQIKLKNFLIKCSRHSLHKNIRRIFGKQSPSVWRVIEQTLVVAKTTKLERIKYLKNEFILNLIEQDLRRQNKNTSKSIDSSLLSETLNELKIPNPTVVFNSILEDL